MNRYQQYGLIHKGMKMKLAVELGEFTDEAYRACLKKLTSKSSCKDMTFTELNSVISLLREQGYLTTTKRVNTIPSGNKPTDAQWRKLAALAYAKGWSGLQDPKLLAFVQRTTHLSNIKLLTRQLISETITGLEKWS